MIQVLVSDFKNTTIPPELVVAAARLMSDGLACVEDLLIRDAQGGWTAHSLEVFAATAGHVKRRLYNDGWNGVDSLSFSVVIGGSK